MPLLDFENHYIWTILFILEFLQFTFDCIVKSGKSMFVLRLEGIQTGKQAKSNVKVISSSDSDFFESSLQM